MTSRQVNFEKQFSIQRFGLNIEYLFLSVCAGILNPAAGTQIMISSGAGSAVAMIALTLFLSFMAVWLLRIYRLFNSPIASSELHTILDELAPGASQKMQLRYSKDGKYYERSTFFQRVLFVPISAKSDKLVREKLAHELAHVANRDYATYWVYNYMILFLVLGVIAQMFNGNYYAGREGLTEEQAAIMFMGTTIPFILLLFLLFRRGLFLRRREHRADLAASKWRGEKYLALLNRMQRIQRHAQQEGSSFARIFPKSHPKIQRRIELVNGRRLPISIFDIPIYLGLYLMAFTFLFWQLGAIFMLISYSTGISPIVFLPVLSGVLIFYVQIVYFFRAHRWLFPSWRNPRPQQAEPS